MKRLTDRQAAVLQFIIEEVAENGRAPTLGEIQAEFSIQHEFGVTKTLLALERKQYITRKRYQHRGITVLRGADEQHNPHQFCST